jgi:hypothetical protein
MPIKLNKTPDVPYREDPSIPSNKDFPFVGARSTQKPFTRSETFVDLLQNGTSAKIANATDSVAGLARAATNDTNKFLDIPSFLQYPQDLGRNQRYHHFITFNIYQGSSDEVRLGQRVENQASSALLSKGSFGGVLGTEFLGAAGSQLPSARQANAVDLANGGFTPEQIPKILDAFHNATSFSLGGITSDERILGVEKMFQGQIQTLFANSKNVSGSNIKAAWDTAMGVGGNLIGDVGNFFQTLIQQTSRDTSHDLDHLDYDQTGVSGRKLNRSRAEQNIFLANRRFNVANVMSKDTICLYMPQKITFNDQLVYAEEDMGMAKNVIDAYVGKRGAASALIEKAGVQRVSSLINLATDAMGLDNINVAGVRSAATRSVVNPRREVLFKDVGIRQHSFTFEFAPHNAEETETVLNIIRMLRFHAYPGLLGGGGHFFTFPAEFEATFYTITPDGIVMVNDNLPKMARLALQSVSVDYSNGGDFKTYHDAKPAFIRLDLAFQEMEQLTSEHIIHGY